MLPAHLPRSTFGIGDHEVWWHACQLAQQLVHPTEWVYWRLLRGDQLTEVVDESSLGIRTAEVRRHAVRLRDAQRFEVELARSVLSSMGPRYRPLPFADVVLRVAIWIGERFRRQPERAPAFAELAPKS